MPECEIGIRGDGPLEMLPRSYLTLDVQVVDATQKLVASSY